MSYCHYAIKPCPLWFRIKHKRAKARKDRAYALLMKYNTQAHHPCRDAQGLSIINNALKYVSEWSGQNCLHRNPNKCVQCTFSLTGNANIDPELDDIINDNALTTVDTVTYLGVTFARNAKWTNHGEGIFRKCVRLSFFAKKLRRLSTPAEYIRKFAEACVIPIILYCHFSWTS